MAPRSWGELPGLKVKALSGSGWVTFPLQPMLLTASAHLSAVQTAVVLGLEFCNLKRSQGRRHRWPVGHHGPQDLNHPALWPLRPGGLGSAPLTARCAWDSAFGTASWSITLGSLQSRHMQASWFCVPVGRVGWWGTMIPCFSLLVPILPPLLSPLP